MFKFKKLAIALLPLVVFGSTAYANLPGKRMALYTPGLSLVRQATLVGEVMPDKKINFTVSLKLRNREQLEQLANEIYDPKSPHYRQFVTNEEFQLHYAPSPETMNAVQHYFLAHGMQAKIKNGSIQVTATAEQIEHIFQVKINTYRYKNKTVYSNATAPTLSTDIAQYVSGISGLSTIPIYHPALSRPVNNSGAHDGTSTNTKPTTIEMVWNSFVPSAQPTTTSLAGFTGAQLRTAYNVAAIPAVGGVTLDGTGQTIVILDACGTNTSAQIVADANTYNTASGLPLLLNGGNFQTLNPDGTPYNSTCNHGSRTGWEAEIALDVESAHTMAPGAKIALVMVPTGNDLDTGVAGIVNTLITNGFSMNGFPNAYVVSNSWLQAEDNFGINTPVETALLTAKTHAISFNFATGDCGDDNSPLTVNDNCANELSTNYPASSTYASAIGGSSLFVDSTWNYAFETGWGTRVDNVFSGGSGGGVSKYYGPALWQVAGEGAIGTFTAGGYGVINTYHTCGTGANLPCRALPDISMLGDPYTGLLIYVSGATSHQPIQIGGTSLATPLFSGTLTLINQSRALQHGGAQSPIGQAAPYLYTKLNTFIATQSFNLIIPPHQIISGATPAVGTGAPLSAFILREHEQNITFSWDSSLTILENQFWNDVVGLGSPNVPNFVTQMALL